MQLSPDVEQALKNDRTIDIETIGVKSGKPRRIEIWFHNLNGRIIICGSPLPASDDGSRPSKAWIGNLKANPDFLFILKESTNAELKAKARVITDPDDRREIMSAPATQWYRQQGLPLDELVAHSPIVEVEFT